MSSNEGTRPRRRILVAGVAAIVLALPLAQALAAMLRGEGSPISAGLWTALAITSGVLVTLSALRGTPLARIVAGAVGLAGGVVAFVVHGASGAVVVPLAVAIAQALAIQEVAPRLPERLESNRGRAGRTVAWGALALVAVVQLARLSTYMADPEGDFWITTGDPFWAKHQCMSAYVYAADLHRQGEPNVYDKEHYPGLTRDAEPHPTVAHLDGFVEDPFQYPPPFLLIPALGLALTNDFLVMRTVWFALSFALFVGVGVQVARWIGGDVGRRAMLLLPLLAIAPATQFNFQYGQFHFAVILLAVAGMLAFARGRTIPGAALLAAAIVTKIFPVLLLVPLLVRRRWGALAATAGFAAVYLGLTFAVLGPDPFVAFGEYHLPRLASGEAFAFADAWPEVAFPLATANQSPAGLIEKLTILGVAGAQRWEGLANLLFTALLGTLAVVAARRAESRVRSAQVWIALLALASMRSPGAWGDYVPVSALWLLTLLTGELASGPRARALLAVCWGLLFVLPGVLPVPALPPPAVSIPLSIAGFLAMAGLSAWVVTRRAPSPSDI